MVLPVLLGAKKPLIFRTWCPGDELQNASFGTLEPSKDKTELEPDVILAPLLAFDSRGFRLGYGGGFYDRTLEKLRKKKRVSVYGIAYAAQEMDQVIKGPYDQPLDGIVTELGVTRF
jgi:5-formyltetrahydrofolate cyclo-ligase|tara:strand:- start:620 stop:970 length:351 start_codon:yes stop_codon:yes gene_type:complete